MFLQHYQYTNIYGICYGELLIHVQKALESILIIFTIDPICWFREAKTKTQSRNKFVRSFNKMHPFPTSSVALCAILFLQLLL
jgi:hypothetical protein